MLTPAATQMGSGSTTQTHRVKEADRRGRHIGWLHLYGTSRIGRSERQEWLPGEAGGGSNGQ